MEINYCNIDLQNRMKVRGDKVKWYEFDVLDLLPDRWDRLLIDWSKKNAIRKFIVPTSITSREKDKTLKLPIAVIGGESIAAEHSWLFELYNTLFLDCARLCFGSDVCTARINRYAVNLNIQRGAMRYEAHVDSNPVEGLLYVTSHQKGDGGELVVSSNPDSLGPEEIERDCELIYPTSGKLLFFDYRDKPHYTRNLTNEDALRVVVAMNYYNAGCTESERPKDLDKHLFSYGMDW